MTTTELTPAQMSDRTEPERRRMLVEHRVMVEQQIADRHAALELIDRKLSFYPAPGSDHRASGEIENPRPKEKP